LKPKDNEILFKFAKKHFTLKNSLMKKILLLVFLASNYFGNAQNLVFNGNMELFSSENSSPDGWSSSSDFGGFLQNTTDFSEGESSVEFTTAFGSDLSMFTLVDIPLEAGKTYAIKYDYKYLGNNFNADDNIEFSFFSTTNPFLSGTNIQDNNWNTVVAEYKPTETKPDFEASIKVKPASGNDFAYIVLIDNVQVFEITSLSNSDFDLNKKISVLSLKDKQFQIKKTSDIIISNLNAYSILGTKQRISNTSDDFSKFDLSNLSSGIYILQISSNKGNIVKKILVK